MSTTSKKYLGLTLGPLYRTISNVRKTRELWAASYLFSWIMKEVLEEIRRRGFSKSVLTPRLLDEDSYLPAGIYSDRLIMEAPDGGANFLYQIAQDTIKHLATAKAIQVLEGHKLDEVEDFFLQYFKTYVVQVEVKEGENPLKVVNQYLDTAELFPSWTLVEGENLVWKFIQALNKERGKWIEMLFNIDLPIKSLVEIAIQDLEYASCTDQNGHTVSNPFSAIVDSWREAQRKQKDDDEENLILNLKHDPRLKEHFRRYHKYVAVVQADADRLGETIGQLKDSSNFEDFSKTIVKSAKEAVEKIQAYDGLPVYVGGDDLVFFAPVFVKKEGKPRSVFHLIDELNQTFQSNFSALLSKLETEDIEPPTLSFGVAITYYKYPLEEAMEESRRLLDETAKKSVSSKGNKKNAIAYRLLTHSGRALDGIIWRESPSYPVFASLLQKQTDAKGQLLTSLIHRLEDLGPIIRLRKQQKESLKHLLVESFNEPVHKTPQSKAFLYGSETDNGKTPEDGLLELLFTSYQESSLPKLSSTNPYDLATKDPALHNVYVILRLLHFLTRKDDERASL